MKNKKELQEIIDRNGQENPIDIAIEECAELIVALAHWKRNKAAHEEVAGEIADVGIVVDQLSLIFGEELVGDLRGQKLKRFFQS